MPEARATSSPYPTPAEPGDTDARRISVPVTVGLVGFGLSGRVFHAPLIQSNPRLRLTHVLERHRQESKALYPEVKVVPRMDDLLGPDGPELVVVTTPNDTHFDIAARSLEAGKHVVVDKPLTPTTAEAGRLIEIAEEHQTLLSVYQNRRWDGDFQTVQQVVGQGLLGRLVEYEAHFDRYRPSPKPDGWRERAGPGAGLVYDLGSHLIDQALLLFGIPETVTADVRIQREGSPTDDLFEIVLGYPPESSSRPAAGLKVTLKASKLVREPGPRFLLHGTLGSFVKYGADPQEAALQAGKSPADTEPWGVEPEAQWGTLNTELDGRHICEKHETRPGCYPAYYNNLCDAIRNRQTLAVTARHGLNTIRVIELAFQSSAERRTLPWSTG